MPKLVRYSRVPTTCRLDDPLHVPGLATNLLFVSNIQSHGLSVPISDGFHNVHDETQAYATARQNCELYALDAAENASRAMAVSLDT